MNKTTITSTIPGDITVTESKTFPIVEQETGRVLWTRAAEYSLLMPHLISLSDIRTILRGKDSLLGPIFLLMHDIDYQGYICYVDSHRPRQKEPATVSDIASKILLKSLSHTRRLLRELEDCRVVERASYNDKDVYKLSPVFAIRGRRVDAQLLYDFEDQYRMHPQMISYSYSRKAVNLMLQRPDPVMPDTPEQIFHDLLLRGEPPKLYTKRGNGMVRYDYDTIRSDVPIFFLVNGMGYYKETKPKNEDMTVHDILMLDFDIEKSEDPDKTAEEVEAALQKLPPCTVKVHSGHGIHVYWKLAESLPADAWKNLQTRLAQSVPHADTAVKDASRVMRYPGSYNLKDPDDPRLVRILEARRVTYDSQDIEQALTRSFPVPVQYTTVSRPAPVPKVYTDSRRIADIRNGVLIRVPHTPRVFESKKDLIAYTHTLDLSKFLQLPMGGVFFCLFHDDKHPSAYIAEQDGTYKYFCRTPDCCVSTEAKGFDMIELVQRLQGVSFSKALSYIAAVYKLST